MGEGLSTSYVLERGVKQGSILSPALFLLVMDPLLSLLENSGIGLSINNLYAGGFIHADDIRTLASSSDSLQKQITMVENFCTQNFLQLNVQKCEIVAFSLSRSGGDIKLPDGVSVPQRKHAKCLGYWWERDLLANCCVEQNITKARGCFFHYGSLGAFQGDINPLSTKSIIDTCVMPVLLYGCENWVLTNTLLQKLGCFLGWAAKRALKWPAHFSNTAALICLGMESIKARILTRKLAFLKHLLSDESVGVGSATMHSLLDDPDSICIVRECRELEASFGTQFTDQLLSDADNVSVREIKNHLLETDKEKMLATCDTKAPLIANVCKCGGAWPAVWDSARHLGSRHTLGLQSLTRLLAHHGKGSSPCPKCDVVLSDSTTTLIDHVLCAHVEITKLAGFSTETVISKIANRDIIFVYRFRSFFLTH